MATSKVDKNTDDEGSHQVSSAGWYLIRLVDRATLEGTEHMVAIGSNTDPDNVANWQFRIEAPAVANLPFAEGIKLSIHGYHSFEGIFFVENAYYVSFKDFDSMWVTGPLP